MLKKYFDVATYLDSGDHAGVVLAYACVCSLFLPVYLTILPVIALFGWILLNRQARKAAAALPGAPFLLLFCVLTVAVPAIYGNGIGALTGVILTVMIVAGMGFRVILKKWQYERALSLICAGSVFGFFTAAVQRISNLHDKDFRPSSITVNPNYYAALAALAALICIYKVACKSPYWLVYISLLIMNLLGMELAKCRGAIGALIFSIVVFFTFNRQKRFLLLSLFLFLGFALILLLHPALLGRFQTMARDLAVRRDLWEAGIAGFLQSPVFGKGSFTFLFDNIPSLRGFYPHSHNLVIEFLLNYGVAGAALFSVYTVQLLRAIYAKGARSERRHFALIASVCAYTLAHGMMDCTLIWPSVMVMTLFIFSTPQHSGDVAQTGTDAPGGASPCGCPASSPAD